MYIIEAENVHQALVKGINLLVHRGEKEESRNGAVLVASSPVVTVYQNPTQRVLFGEIRDANPFFHLMESLWMLAGRNDLEFPRYFNSKFGQYSDDGKFVHGAYGYRWRNWFGMDQIMTVVDELKTKPNSRRAVISMWSPAGDLCAINFKDPTTGEVVDSIGGMEGKDVPCNTQAYFDVRHGKLNMTVLCRSNDIIWGAYGANVVHFSILQEYMAAAIGVEVGIYRQFSNNFHAYTDVFDLDKLKAMSKETEVGDLYYEPHASMHGVPVVKPFPLVSPATQLSWWNNDLKTFMKEPTADIVYTDPFFNGVARPMYMAYKQRKDKQGSGIQFAEQIIAEDWKSACIQWISRRETKQ